MVSCAFATKELKKMVNPITVILFTKQKFSVRDGKQERKFRGKLVNYFQLNVHDKLFMR
jgi:hypothetical protein